SFRQRFQREAKLQAQLRHPNVARVLDYLEDGGQWFLVVEYLDRGSLADVLSRDGARVPRAQALAWARQALSGLGYAHKKGIVHRDVKPANLLLNDTGELVVADFGIARADGVPSMTTTGIAVGSPDCEAMTVKLARIAKGGGERTRRGLVAPPAGIPLGARVRATSLREPA